MDYSLQGSLVHGIFQERIPEWVAPLVFPPEFPPPGDLPDPGMEPRSPELAGEFFTTGPPGKTDPQPWVGNSQTG